MSDRAVPLEDAVSFKELKEQPLYASRIKIHPKDVQGTFRRIKWTALLVLLGIYYLVPWIRWDRGPGAPDQAVLIDMPARRAYFFWIEIWPQEIYFLTLLLILAAFGLFFVTSMFGRVWCGYTCPQTVWTDLFMWVERRIEGDRGARIRLDKAPWTAEKLRKRALKHGAWLLIAFLTGGAWIMYFNDAPTLVREFFTGQAGLAVYFFVGLFTTTTYLLAGWAREQVCVYMCPWPRIQGALLDHDSYVVTYQNWRGEPRAPLRKNTDWDQRGDCIACNNCVAVCPTGIDIRDGLQLECIGCGLCIDACNDVMARIGRPPDLITLDTERNQQRLARGDGRIHRLIRKRTVMYAVIITLLGLAILIGLGTRATVDVNVLHDRNPLFVTLADGSIRNGYTIKILNKSRAPKSYFLSVDGLEGSALALLGQESDPGERIRVEAGADTVATYRVALTAPRGALDGAASDIEFVLEELEGGGTSAHDTVFRGPG
jgi:cytochrome c oxidase accessory protein FixG